MCRGGAERAGRRDVVRLFLQRGWATPEGGSGGRRRWAAGTGSDGFVYVDVKKATMLSLV